MNLPGGGEVGFLIRFSSLAATMAPRQAPTVYPIEDQKICVI